MPAFILLTESMTGGDTRPLLLPVSEIGHVQCGKILNKDTHIRMIYRGSSVNGEAKTPYYFVRESFEEVARKLGV